MVDYTSQALIERVRTLASVPNNQQIIGDNASILEFFNWTQYNNLLPDIMKLREEYFVKVSTFTTQNNVSDYTIPSAAVGLKLRDVLRQTTVGATTTYSSIPQINPEMISSPTWLGYQSFYTQNDKIVLFPTPKSEWTVRLTYFTRPNVIVDIVETGKIVSIDTVANTVVVDNLPLDWTTGTVVDIISGVSGFQTLDTLTIVNLSSPTIYFNDVSNLRVGDYIALQGCTPIPQFPVECHNVLVQAAVVKLLEAQNDETGIAIAQRNYDLINQKMQDLLAPRVDGENVKVSTNGKGIADANNYNRFSRYWY